MSDCEHEFRVIDGKVKGHNSLTTEVIKECTKCGGLTTEEREKIND